MYNVLYLYSIKSIIKILSTKNFENKTKITILITLKKRKFGE
jgi:hypothetical protein